MKRLLAISLLSISVAGHLAFATWHFGRGPTSRADETGARTSSAFSEGETPEVSRTALPSARGQTGFSWAPLAHASDADFATALRRAGFPADVLRELVRRRVQKRYQEKLDALATKPLPYWRHRIYTGDDDQFSPEVRAQRRELQRQINEEVRRAVGGEIFECQTPYERAVRERSYGALPKEKADQVALLRTDYDELQRQIYDIAGGVLLPSDLTKLKLLETETRDDLATIMTPDELFEYDLRTSGSAHRIQALLSNFPATEAEFRTFTKMQLEFDARQSLESTSPDEIAKRKQAEKELEAQLLAALPPDRAAELAPTLDPAFASNRYFLRQFKFDARLARDLVLLRRDVAARANAVRQHPLYTTEQKAAELAALQREALGKLGAQLSPSALENYRKHTAGGWLEALPSATEASKP